MLTIGLDVHQTRTSVKVKEVLAGAEADRFLLPGDELRVESTFSYMGTGGGGT